MDRYHRQFRCEVLTPRGTVCDVQAVSVVLPAVDGLLGVLGGRAPLVAVVGAGRFTLEPRTGEVRQFFISGGFAQVRANVLTMLAEQCQPVQELDATAAREELREARALPAATPAAAEQRDQAVAAARAKYRIAREALEAGRTGHPPTGPRE